MFELSLLVGLNVAKADEPGVEALGVEGRGKVSVAEPGAASTTRDCEDGDGALTGLKRIAPSPMSECVDDAT